MAATLRHFSLTRFHKRTDDQGSAVAKPLITLSSIVSQTSLGSAARALGYDQDKLPDGATGWDLCHNHKIRQ
jgi:hypothetical protein